MSNDLVKALAESRWQVRAAKLIRLLESHAAAGFPSKRMMLEEAALRSGRRAASLKSEIAALRAAERLGFRDLDDPAFGAGAGLINWYRRLASLDPDAARAVQDQVWRGDISIPALRKLIDERLERGALPQASTNMTATRAGHAKDFERQVGQQLLVQASNLLKVKGVTIEVGSPHSCLPVDFVARLDGRIIACFEVKAGSGELSIRRSLDLLARAALYQRAYKSSWLIVEWSEQAERMLLRLKSTIEHFHLNDIHLALYDQECRYIKKFPKDVS